MTCIVGWNDVENGVVWLGGDSMGSNGYTHSIETGAKVFHHEDMKDIIIGSTSTFRHIDLLKYNTGLFSEVDVLKKPDIDRKYIVRTFIPRVKDLFQGEIVSESEVKRGGNFLMGVNGHLFEIQSDYSVLEDSRNYSAIGGGAVAALGSLYATKSSHKDWTPKEHILCALRASEQCCDGVHGPFVIVNTKNDQVEVIT